MTELASHAPALIDVRIDIERLLGNVSNHPMIATLDMGRSEQFDSLASLQALDAHIENGALVLRCSTNENISAHNHDDAISRRHRLRSGNALSQLPTPREIKVLALVREGRRNREIAELLHISEDTVKTRLKNAMAKLCASNRTHAVTLARQRGLLDDATLR